MNRRFFLRFLGLSTLAAPAVIIAARAWPAGAPASATAADMVRASVAEFRSRALRNAIDACYAETDAIRAKYEPMCFFYPNRTAELAWFREADPHYLRAYELEKLLEASA